MIPAKKAATVAQPPVPSPRDATRDFFASKNISTKDTYIITPAEKPRASDRNFLLVVLARTAMALPTPVERPAMAVSAKAMRTAEVSIGATPKQCCIMLSKTDGPFEGKH